MVEGKVKIQDIVDGGILETTFRGWPGNPHFKPFSPALKLKKMLDGRGAFQI